MTGRERRGVRALGAVLTYLHPSEWRSSLRRQVGDLVADQVRVRADAHAAVVAERQAAVAVALHREQLLIQAAGVLAGSGHKFSPGQTGLLLREVPVDDAGALDETAFAVRAFEEAASYAEEAGPAVRAAVDEED